MTSSAKPAPPVIDLHEVHVLFRETCALDIERLSLNPRERLFVLGRSGSGKTTLSRLIKGRLQPSTGQVRVLGENPAVRDRADRRAIQRRIAMIDQEFFLIPRLTVLDNVLSGALGRVSVGKSMFGWYPRVELEKAGAILSEVGMDGFEARRVETLSGGQRQRTAIARALMQEADVILADEPISNLDPEFAEDALELLVACVERRSVTLLVNLHQPSLARRFASRIVGLSAGKIVYDGPPETFDAAASQFLYQAPGEGGQVVYIGKAGGVRAEG
jgi:phosphonate transport system ATP-binding protein